MSGTVVHKALSNGDVVLNIILRNLILIEPNLNAIYPKGCEQSWKGCEISILDVKTVQNSEERTFLDLDKKRCPRDAAICHVTFSSLRDVILFP